MRIVNSIIAVIIAIVLSVSIVGGIIFKKIAKDRIETKKEIYYEIRWYECPNFNRVLISEEYPHRIENYPNRCYFKDLISNRIWDVSLDNITIIELSKEEALNLVEVLKKDNNESQ